MKKADIILIISMLFIVVAFTALILAATDIYSIETIELLLTTFLGSLFTSILLLMWGLHVDEKEM